MTFYFRGDTGPTGSLISIAKRETARNYRRSVPVDSTFTRLLDDYHQLYPDMDAGVAVTLARNGVLANSPEAQQIARDSAVAKGQSAVGATLGPHPSFKEIRRYAEEHPEEFRSGKRGLFGDLKAAVAPIGEAVGKVVAPVARVADTALGNVDERLTPGIKGAVRTGFAAIESPLQETQTLVRAHLAATLDRVQEVDDIGGLLNLFNPVEVNNVFDNDSLLAQTLGNSANEHHAGGGSTAYQSISDLIDGKRVDLGHGFLPGGEVAKQRQRAATVIRAHVGDVEFGGPNKALTLGRAAASIVTEPGTTPYNVLSGLVDAGVTWYGDPTIAVGKAAKEAELAGRAGRAARAVVDDSLKAGIGELRTAPTFRVPAPSIVEDVTGRLPGVRNTVLGDVADEWLTKGGQRVVERMAGTDNFYDLWQATGKKLPVSMTVKLADAKTPQEVMAILRPAIGLELREAPEYLGYKVNRSTSKGVRLLQAMPGDFIDPGDLDGAVEQADRWLRNAKVSPALRNRAIEKIARNPGREAMVTTMSDIMGDVAAELAERGRPLGAKPLPVERVKELTRMFGGDAEKTRAYFLDEIAENRKAAGVLVGGERSEVASPFLMTEYLNSVIPLPDAREMRRATSTLARLVDTTPFEVTTGLVNSLQGVWKKLALMRGAYTVRVVGEEQVRMAASGLDSMFAHPLSAISALIADEDSVSRFIGTGRKRQVDVLGAEFFDDAGEAASVELKGALNQGWAGWVDETVYDRNFTTFAPTDEGYKRAWAQSIGELYTDPVARAVAGAEGNLDSVKGLYWDGPLQWARKRLIADRPELATKVGADAYLDTLWEGVQYRTGSDPTLMKAIATGAIHGERFGKLSEAGKWNFTDAFEAHLDTIQGPAAVKGQRIVRQGVAPGVGEVWDNATGWIFSHLMTKPTNWLSRSQTFRQRYWQRIEEMVPYMDDATRAKAIANAEGVVDSKQLGRMRSAPRNAERRLAKIGDADHLAKQYALDETKQLLYDLSDRGQFFDVFRLIFPFGEAWKEVVTRWAKIGMENPNTFRRAQQVITGARGSGFFSKDVNGEEVFTYPGSQWLTKKLTGIPVPMTGRVSGLSLMTDVLPGVGPVVQMPAAALLPDTPDWDFARKFMFPFGEQDFSQGVLESFLPGFARNLAQGWFQKGDPRLFANTVGATMDYLASTGDYDLSDPEEQARLLDDAREKAKAIYTIRGFIQFGAPTSPSPEFLIKDKDGKLDVSRVVLQDLYKMQEEDYDSATGKFLDKYGPDVFLLLQGKTRSKAPALPVTKKSSEWERAHPDLVKKYGLTWGLFADKGDTDDFDYVAYVRQIKRGERIALTPEQRISLAQSKVARWVYEEAKKKVSEKPNKAEKDWLAAVKERLVEEYPGFGDDSVVVKRASTPKVVAELERAIKDPKLKDTKPAKATAIYLAARRRAYAFLPSVGVKSLDAAAAEPARKWLAAAGQKILAQYPEFEETYDTVFSWEVDD